MTKVPSKAAMKRLALRDQLWPDMGEELWHRSREDGYSTVPRTLPLVMTLIDLPRKGKDASRVYLDLWCRQMDDSFVDVTDEEAFAFSCGYTTPGRNIRTWKERIKILEELGLVSVQPKGSRRYGYLLLLHPHKTVKKIRSRGHIPDSWWGAYLKRASEIGATLP